MSTNLHAPESDIPPPGDFIREELKRRNWTQEDLARILGRPLTRVNEIIQGKQGITPETALALGMAFDTTPDLWLQREAEYRLALDRQTTFRLAATKPEASEVKRRKRLFEVAPVKELQRRGWISSGDDPEKIERDVLKLFGTASLDEEPQVQALMRRSNPVGDLSPAQKAWACRVRQLARSILVAEYRDDRLPKCIAELRKVAAYSQEVRKVPTILASYGIRFVVVEPLPSGKLDGMATWLDEQSPVIGMSLRFDRLDNFWQTLCHEVTHIKHRDPISVDDDLSGSADPEAFPLHVKPPIERRADSEGAAMLIPSEELDCFIRRVGPLYGKERINQFANRLKIHPGIIVGQLQHRGEIGFSANREMLIKIRRIVVEVALTDGWGHSIDPRVLG